MIRTFRYPLYPTRSQAEVLERWLVLCQRLYNGALEERREAWRKQRKSLSQFDQQIELTQLREQDSEYGGMPLPPQRSALRRLELAFQSFFRRLKNGETPGFPRFRSRDRYDSFSIGRVTPWENRVLVPRLGQVKFKLYRPLRGFVREAQIRQTADRWYICFSCDLGEAPPKVAVRSVTGIDVGLINFAVLSDGTAIENPRFLRQSEARIACRQRALARKKRGSNGRHRAKLLVAKSYEQLRNQRLDFVRKLSAILIAKYDLIAHEDLKISRMVRGNLSKSILDAAWGIFLHALACKAEEAGKHVVAVDPRGTTQRCSGCGTRVPKLLSQREHACDRCGLRLGRDHNAALNIHALGLSAAETAHAV